MATGKAKSLDKMKLKELTEILEVLGLSDEGVENLSDARSQIRSALDAAEKTSNSWSPGEVRYFSVSEGFRTVRNLAGVHECPSRGAAFRDCFDGSYATLNRYCLRPKETGGKITVLFHLCTAPKDTKLFVLLEISFSRFKVTPVSCLVLLILELSLAKARR